MLEKLSRRISLVMCAALVASLALSNVSLAAVKSGASCSKKSSTQIVGSKKFTCVLKGKKLVWDAGVIIKSNPSASVPSTPPAPVKEIIFVDAAKAEPGKDCDGELLTAYSLSGPLICTNQLWTIVKFEEDSVESRAYRYVLDKWNKTSPTELNLTMYIDPNTPEWKNQIEKGMKAGAQFWGTSNSTAKPIPVFISGDGNQIVAMMEKAGLTVQEDTRKRVTAPMVCQAGFTGLADDPSAFWNFNFSHAGCLNSVGFWQVPAHEYTHYAQAKLSGNKHQSPDSMPWIVEGMAAFIGAALGPMSDMPHDLMTLWKKDAYWGYTTLSNFSSTDREVYESPKWGDIYPQGAVAFEAIVALFGIESLSSYLTDLSKGVSQQDAYLKNFQMSRENLITFGENYVTSVRGGKPMTLTELKARYEKLKTS